MDPRISVITLGVADLDRAIAFYRDGLELPLQERDDDQDIAFFPLAGTWLALFPRELLAEDARADGPGEGFGNVTLAHNVEPKEEVDAILERAEAAGGEIVKAPDETFWGGYSGYFTDPDGHYWEVAYPPLDPDQVGE